MPEIEITEECRVLIEGATEPFRRTGRRLPNGNWQIPIDAATRQWLEKLGRQGEAISSSSLSLGAACDSRAFGLITVGGGNWLPNRRACILTVTTALPSRTGIKKQVGGYGHPTGGGNSRREACFC